MSTRFPFKPVLDLLQSRHGDDLCLEEISEVCGFARGTMRKWKYRGYIPVFSADKVAVALGKHPYELWGEDYLESEFWDRVLQDAC